jgi:hypothetical protein
VIIKVFLIKKKTFYLQTYYYENYNLSNFIFIESNSKMVENTLRQVMIPSTLTFAELKSTIYSWVNVEENNSKIVKLRRYDNNLIPLSTLLQGSSEQK